VLVKSTQDVDIWMGIPFQEDICIWVNYSVSSYLNFILIFWNVLIWLQYNYMHHLSLYFDIFSLRQLRRYQKLNFEDQYGYLRANTDIWGQIRYLRANTDICPEDKKPTLTSSYYWTCKNEHFATKYVIIAVIVPENTYIQYFLLIKEKKCYCLRQNPFFFFLM
jgi:hypothetical protein